MFNLEIKKGLTELDKLAFVAGWIRATGKNFCGEENEEQFVDWLVKVHKLSETEAEEVSCVWSKCSFYRAEVSARKYLKRLEEKKNRDKKLDEALENVENELKKLKDKKEK